MKTFHAVKYIGPNLTPEVKTRGSVRNYSLAVVITFTGISSDNGKGNPDEPGTNPAKPGSQFVAQFTADRQSGLNALNQWSHFSKAGCILELVPVVKAANKKQAIESAMESEPETKGQ